MATLQIRMPAKLVPVFQGDADVRGAYGGRGSAKTRTFAKMTAVRAHMWASAGRTGTILCGRQFMNSLEDSSLEEIKAAIREEPMLAPHFDIGEKYVRTKCRRVYYSFAGLDRNIHSVKSKAKILLCWVEEAEPVTDSAWETLIPTLREEDSELWVTWNRERKKSATNKRFGEPSNNPRVKIVEMNWRDNPWFPAILNRKRLEDKEKRPDTYEHIWEGAYKTITEGAYYAKHIAEARRTGRVTPLSIDPLMSLRAFWDIGGTGAKADATAIWVGQFVGERIKALAHYEAQGQDLATHVNWLRGSGFGRAECFLPHDGANGEKVIDTSYERALRQAGFNVTIVPNQGMGAAMKRVEAGRRWFPRIWFNDTEDVAAGLEALAHYHEKRDEAREVGLGPNHDWSSHSADAFGMMCSVYKEPMSSKPLVLPRIGAV
jgi:phage terminase large subunit